MSRGGGLEGQARGDARAVAQLLKTEMVLPCPEMLPHQLVLRRIMCMGVESFTEENRGSATCGPYISL